MAPPTSSRLFLGIRTAPEQTRFALLQLEDLHWSLLNTSSDSLIRRPGNYEDPAYINWLLDEITALLQRNPTVERIALKVPEFTQSVTHGTRLRNYLDAAVQIAATRSNVTIATRMYTQMATRAKDVKHDAETRVGRTDAQWDPEIADAIMAARSLVR
jgi:hypothetical protein